MEREGKAQFRTGAFYNPVMELNRDITVAVLRAWESESDSPTYLDVMGATGIRGLRALLETDYNAVINDRSKEAFQTIEANLNENNVDAEVYCKNANVLMHSERYEAVDVDPFGSPAPYMHAAFNSATELACFTATDTAPLCGAHDSGVRRYSCKPLNTEYHPEIGLRVLLGSLIRAAAASDIACTPILSHVSDHYARTYLSLEEGAKPADTAIQGLGYISHCYECLYRSTSKGLVYGGERECPYCNTSLRVAGPLWLDPVRDPDFVGRVINRLSDYMGTYDRAMKLLQKVRDELNTPTHYDHHRLCREWNVTPGKIEEFIEELRMESFSASRTHYSGTSFKTDADVRDIKEVMLDQTPTSTG